MDFENRSCPVIIIRDEFAERNVAQKFRVDYDAVAFLENFAGGALTWCFVFFDDSAIAVLKTLADVATFDGKMYP